MAESQGFEPRDLVKGQRFSRPPHSTALPTLRSANGLLPGVLYQKLKNMSTMQPCNHAVMHLCIYAQLGLPQLFPFLYKSCFFKL